MKTTIWYEMTDERYIKVLRDAADKLEKDGYVKILLSNVEIGDPRPSGGGGPHASSFSSGRGGGSGSWAPVMGGSGAGGSPQGVSASGGNGFSSGSAYGLDRAKATGRPVCYAGGGGGGMKGFGDWAFPDGHTERLPAGETPQWPKDNPVRDAIHANP